MLKMYNLVQGEEKLLNEKNVQFSTETLLFFENSVISLKL